MWNFDESAARLPPPHDGEPGDLRREIVEELTDHLTCARRREQMAGGEQTEESIRRRVLDRFGDPAAVARKLWLDWMWEKIMTQRILVGICVLMAVVSCIALGLAWASLSRQQDMIAIWQSTSQSQMREQQKLFERLLAQSDKALAQGGASAPHSIEWNPVELRFVTGKEDGPPMKGVQARMSMSTEGSNIPQLSGVSDERGIIRFERVHYGSYRLRVTTPAEETVTISLTQQPGEGLSKTIACPDPPAEPQRVVPRIEWPREMVDRPLWFRFRQSGVYRPIGDRLWGFPSLLPGNYREIVLIEPNGQVHGTPRMEAGTISSPRQGSRTYVQTPFPVVPWETLTRSQVEDYSDGILWPGSAYEIRDLEVLMPVPEVATLEELHSSQPPPIASRFGAREGRVSVDERVFFALALRSADWPHRIERGTDGKPGTLWLTPTDEAIEKVREALAQIDMSRETAEKVRAEAEQARRAQSEANKQESADAEEREAEGGEQNQPEGEKP